MNLIPNQTLIDQAVTFRKELHQHPELTWQEFNTAKRIRNKLDQLDIAWTPCAETGTIGVIAPNAKLQNNSKNIALRGDIDALPITEITESDCKSQNVGVMHACGHDGHTATLWAVAAMLKEQEAELTNTITLLFQPAEEGGHGAKKMVEAGALKDVDFVFGWHNWPKMAFGTAACPDHTVMAGNGRIRLTIIGKGGHASQPEHCHDPVLAASAITLNLQQIVSRRLPPQNSAVVSITSIDAKSAFNVTRDQVTVEGGIRFTDQQDFELMKTIIPQIASDTALSYGCRVECKIGPIYPATVNNAKAAHLFRHVLQDVFGENWLDETTKLPVMGSEDFSYFLQEKPGAYALIGATEGLNFAHSLHHPEYQFNDALISKVVQLFTKLAYHEY